jgi:hypothetical protein
VTAADDGRKQRSLSFGSQAAAYERGRPSYPPSAVDWLLSSAAGAAVHDVLDLGAGTGKLTSRQSAVWTQRLRMTFPS